MKKLIPVIMALWVTVLFSGPGLAGTKTANEFFYKPPVGARGAIEKTAFDAGLDRVDARLGKEIWVGDPRYGTTLQDAANAIGTARAILRVPAGTYSISANLSLPANITLRPEQGAVFTIDPDKTLTVTGGLEAGRYQIFSCAGTGKVVFGAGAVKTAYPEWWGAKRDGATDDSTAINAALTSNCGEVFFSEGTYLGNVTLLNCKTNLRGAGVRRTFLESATNTGYILEFTTKDGLWRRQEVSDLTLRGKNGTTRTSNGVSFGVPGGYVAGAEAIGMVTFSRCSFQNLDKCIYKPFGNLGIICRGCSFESANYHYYVELSGASNYHGGCDVFEDLCEFRGAELASVYINGPSDTGSIKYAAGQTVFHDCIFELNNGFGIFVYQYSSAVTPGPILENCWFEGNHQAAGTVTINSVAYTPMDIYARNCQNFQMTNTPIGHIQLVNAKLYAYHPVSRELSSGGVPAGYERVIKDADSAFYVDGINVLVSSTTPAASYYAATIHGMTSARGYGACVVTRPRSKISTQAATWKGGTSFANANSYEWNGTGGPWTGTSVADGRIFDSCCEIQVPAATDIYHSLGYAATPMNKYVAWTVDLKQVSGEPVKFYLYGITNAASGAQFAMDSSWQTYAGIVKGVDTGTVNVRCHLVGGAGGSGTVRISAFQVHAFDTYEEAVKFLDSGVFTVGTLRPRIIYSPAAPTTGTWTQGDICYNTTPAAGGTPGWVCTAAGTPGTWKAMANLAP